jgi:hypothetical protein
MGQLAWKTMTSLLVEGIRSMSHIQDNPQWWVIEVFDGFDPHTPSYYAMKHRYDNKILSLKEEGDSSHVNQAYVKFGAKNNKSLQKEGLSIVQDHRWKQQVHQTDLIHVGLFILRGTKPETWTTSFGACNMEPRTRVPFPNWGKKLSSVLCTGQIFKAESVVDKYALLPSFWHGTKPEIRKRLLASFIA